MTEPIHGERALAWGAVEAGVNLVTGYPGSPGTHTFNALSEMSKKYGHTAEWCPNERIALDMAAGASQGGKRALVCLKSVGMNVALDTLMVLNMTGVHAGLVILMGDDPGAWGSQNEQDTRPLGPLAETPMLEPSTPAEGREMMRWAFEFSETHRIVVILRITRSYSVSVQALSPLNPPEAQPAKTPDREPFRWISALPTTARNHRGLHQKLQGIAREFQDLPFNALTGNGKKGIITTGMVHAKLTDALQGADTSALSILKLGALYPLPGPLISGFLAGCDQVLVLEEVDPYLEDAVKTFGYDAGATPPILGKRTGHVNWVGELFRWHIQRALDGFIPDFSPETRYTRENGEQEIPPRKNACAGCPYPQILTALREEAEKLGQNPFLTADPGCVVLAARLLDTKLSMGSAIGVACGLARAGVAERAIAIFGDSAFYHGGINALIHARATRATPVVLILDNGGSLTTGGQSTPDRGMPLGETNGPRITIRDLCTACGVSSLREIPDSATDLRMREVFRQALNDPDLNVVLVRKACSPV